MERREFILSTTPPLQNLIIHEDTYEIQVLKGMPNWNFDKVRNFRSFVDCPKRYMLVFQTTQDYQILPFGFMSLWLAVAKVKSLCSC